MWDCAASLWRCAQPGIEPGISYFHNKNQSIRPLNEVPELQGSHNFRAQSSENISEETAEKQKSLTEKEVKRKNNKQIYN